MEYLIFGSAVIIIVILLLILMQKQTSNLREQLRQALDNTTQTVSQRIETTSKVISDVQKDLARLEESNKRIYEVGKDISSLQEILRAPKLRGIVGEFLLSDLLGQILPGRHFSLSHQFKSGERVDAVIHLAALSNDPLGELAPGLTDPRDGRTMRELLDNCPDRSWVRKFGRVEVNTGSSL